MKYFVSDTHFLHKGIMRHCPWRNRWPDVNSMNEGIIEIWNYWVKPEDTVYVLGDLALGKPNKLKKIINRLNGHKIIVLGNHDLGKQFYLDNGFEFAYDENIATDVCDEDGHRLTVSLSHYPFKPSILKKIYYFFFDRDMLRGLDKHPVDNGQVLLHGHVHDRWGRNGRMINVGLDAHVGPNKDPMFVSERMVMDYIRVFDL